MPHRVVRHDAYHHLFPRGYTRPDPVPPQHQYRPQLTVPEAPSIVRRDSQYSSTCSADNKSAACAKPTSSSLTTTLPVVLGAVIPVVCAIVVLVFLHRRHVRKLRHEDANDKHKSLDFGMEVVRSGGGGKPEMGEKPHKRGGMSLDIGASPYLLPPGLQNSRESLRSLSKVISADGDKYRPATSLAAHGDNTSLRSYPSHSKWGQDDASSIADSTRQGARDDIQQGLLRNASRMSRSSPPRQTPSPGGSNGHHTVNSTLEKAHMYQAPETGSNFSHGPFQTDSNHLGLASGDGADGDMGHKFSGSSIYVSEPSLRFDLDEVHHDANHNTGATLPGQTLPTRDSSLDEFNFATGDSHSSLNRISIPTIHESAVEPYPVGARPPRISLPLSDVASDYGDEPKFAVTPPTVNVSTVPDSPPDGNGPSSASNRLTQHFASFDDSFNPHRLTVGIRPLPPEDPTDNAEQRANRIRSFYKEYFDDTKGGQEEYHEDFGPEFFGDGAVYDPHTGDYFMAPPKPFAQPVGRRAMTPPPRFHGVPRHMGTNSAAGFMSPGPRAFSSASGRLPGARGPRKPAPPPAPLHVLPSPHLIKDDMSIMPIDYAPGKSFKDQREGRPETPQGGLRPFTPALSSHVLASSFDDLAVIPSPHALRKSGLYTSLDFAPPARFKNSETGSDTGSIRSNRTGISAAHVHNIRAGAYRVSRLPAETVGTRDDIASTLRPKWDMR